LEAADVDPGEDHERVSRVHPDDQGTGEIQGDVDLPGYHGLDGHPSLHLDVLHVGEPLGLQELFRQEVRGDADGWVVGQSNPRRLGG
jgi:hypothetical protein